ncbi:MAG: polysaccharide deacetylase family protein [Christensenellales bacterium]|jgi:peptidoglycan/xylan/chitin deacetylase (PgdA/CDA1 family)
MARYKRPGARNRRTRHTLFAATAVFIFALIAVIAILPTLRGGSASDRVAKQPVAAASAETPTPAETSAPTATPAPTPTPAPTAAYRVVVPRPSEEGFLPIVKRGETNDPIIAVTVDDFYQFANARRIIDIALENGANLTLFPIGINVLRRELMDTLRYAYESGMQIENHTHEHVTLCRADDEEMARQIYLQSLAVNYVLGVDYQQHFFRPRGGDGIDDQRTHLYAEKLGMRAIAHWTISGSDMSLNRMLETLAPGNIYLFHTTDADTQKLETFIPAAIEAGYTLVTMNEMFGYPENEVKPLADEIDIHDIPMLGDYQIKPRTYQTGDYQWVVNLLQQRLNELGYLEDPADGIYGHSTFLAVGYFQLANDIEATGVADVETQAAIHSDLAIPNPSPNPSRR